MKEDVGDEGGRSKQRSVDEEWGTKEWRGGVRSRKRSNLARKEVEQSRKSDAEEERRKRSMILRFRVGL